MTTTQPSTVDVEAFPHWVRAAVTRAVGEPTSVETIRLRAVGPDDVRVRIEQTGVGHSDLSLARGVLAQPLPAVLGHEACGTVVETGERVTDLEIGQRVTLLWITSCGHCFHCTHDEPHPCVTGSSRAGEPYALTHDGEPVHPGLTVGSFAEQTVVPRGALVPVPDDIDTADAALLGCAVTTGVGAVVSTAQVSHDSSVLVLGLGGVGLSVVQGARLVGASTIIAVPRTVGKAELALAAGATHFLPADDGTTKAARGRTDGRGADSAFDWVRAGDLDLRRLVTGTGTPTDVDAALDELAAGRGIRTVLHPEGA